MCPKHTCHRYNTFNNRFAPIIRPANFIHQDPSDPDLKEPDF